MRSIRLGEFVVCPDEGRVEGPTGKHRLEPKVMAVLAELMRQPGEVVTRQQLMDRVWTGLVVTDDAVTRCISELRNAFGDNRQAPRYVETLPKRGYRLLVGPTAPAPEEVAAPEVQRQTPTRRRPRALIGLIVAVAGAIALWLGVARWQGAAPIPSVAIVPFVMVPEGGPDAQYFSEGLAEELLNALVRVKGLRVASRSDSFALSEGADGPVEAAKALGVDAILTGTLRRTGERLRINAQLIDAKGGFHLWAESYDRALDDLFAMQDDIATQVAHALGANAQRAVQVARLSTNMQAFDYYLLGRHHWHKRTPESLKRSVEFFSQAIELDPGFALAHSGLADGYLLLASYGDFPADRAVALARTSVDRALALDPALAEGHASRGMLMLQLEDYPEAEHALRQAVKLNPHYAMGLMWLGNALKSQGQVNESLEWYQKAQALDPTHPVLRQNLASALMMHGDYVRAEAMLGDQQPTRLGAPNVVSRMEAMLSLNLAFELARFDDAAQWANTLLSDPQSAVTGYTALAEIARLSNDRDAARAWLATAAANEKTPNYDLYVAALKHYALVDDTGAFNEQVERWHAEADQGQEPTMIELAWRGVLETRVGEHQAAVGHLESALAAKEEKSTYPPYRLWAIGHLLLAYRGLQDDTHYEAWLREGNREAADARAAGVGSIPFLLEEAYFRAAAGDAHGAVAAFGRVVAAGGRLGRETFEEPRLAPIRESPEFVAFVASIDLLVSAVAAVTQTCVVGCATRTESLRVDPTAFRVPVRALPRAGNTAAEIPHGQIQGS